MADDPLLGPPPDPLAGPPPREERNTRAEQRARGWRFNIGDLGGQFAAGAATTPTDVLGLIGMATGNQSLQDIAQRTNDRVNDFVGVIDPNWWDNTPEYAARVLGGAVVGVPARLAAIAGRAAPSVAQYLARSPVARVAEAVTPITLPYTAGNIARNAVGGGIVGIGIQELADAASAADAAQAAPQASATDPLTGPPPQERTIAQIARDNLPLAVLGAAGVAGGAAALRQMRINREVAQAREAAAVPAQPATATTPAQPEVPGGLVNPDAVAGNLTGVRQESGGERFVRDVVDDTATARARIQEAADAGLIRQDIADEVNAGFGTSVSQAPLQERTNEMLRQGDAFGIRIEGGEAYEIRRIALRDEDNAAYALYMNARAAQNELDDRAYYARIGQLNATRQLSGRTTDELKRIVDAANNDPRVSALIKADSQDNLARLQFAVQEGLITQDEAIKMRAVRPGYLHTLTKDNTPLTRRDMTQSQEPNQVADPIASRQDAWRDVISRAIENRQRRALYDAAQMINARNPNSLRDLGIGRVGPLDWLRKNAARDTEVLPVRINGQAYGIELAPEIASGARTMARATAGWFGGMAQTFRYFTTGPGAALFGSIQAPVSAAYGTYLVGMNRPRGTSGGYIDRMIGNRLPVFDPTFVAAVGSATARMIVAETARATASQLMRSVYSKGPLSRALQAAGVNPQQLQSRMMAFYDASLLAEMRRMGSTGTGLSFDPRAAEMARLSDIVSTPEYARMQSVDKRARGMEAVTEYTRAIGRATTPASAERAWRLFSSYLNIVSDSPVAAFVLLNRGQMNPTTLHGTARRLQGDPALRGASRAVQAATAAMPYSNISIQTTAQLMSTAKQQPFRVAGSLAYLGTLGAVITIYSALEADKEEGGNRHMQALLNASPDRLMAGTMISMAGVDPQDSIRVPVDPIAALVQGLVTIPLSNMVAQGNPQIMAGLGDELGTFLNDRYKPMLISGGSRAFNPLNAPPGLNALSQIMGGPDISNAFDIINPRFGNTPRDVGAPGFSDRRLENDPVSRSVDLIMQDLFGLSGEAALLFMRQVGYGEDVMTAAGQAFMSGFARNPGAAAMFGQTRAQPQRGMIAEQLGPMENTAERVAQSFMQNAVRPGVVGTGSAMREVPNTREGDRVDPSVMELAVQVRALYNRKDLAAKREERRAAQAEIIRLRSQGNDPAVVNQLTNASVDKITQANEYILRAYLAFEREIQRTTGRDFSIARFDPLRPIEQFPRRGE